MSGDPVFGAAWSEFLRVTDGGVGNYTDGIKAVGEVYRTAGAEAERKRIVGRLKIDIANYGEVGTVNFADLIEWIGAAS
jgi:anionic cell wall polymer biosynthesis LytR-Cps2A-Psr (LCP) family protein